LIEENFEFAYFMYIEALKVQKKELGKLSDEELISLRQLNYHYDIDLILQEIFNNKGEKEFLKTIKRIYSLPIPVYIYKFKDVEETLLNLSNTTLTKEVFDVLRGNGMSGDINPYYQELYEKWKTKQKN
jgi:hypothetical protein